MALFRINVDLCLSRETREGLMRLVQAAERQAAALEALLAKANEPDDDVPPALHEQIQEQGVVTEQVAQALAEQAP